MSAKIIDGKLVSAQVRAELKKKVAEIAKTCRVPGLAVIQVGENPSSTIYVNNKHKACEEIGIYSQIIRLDENTTEDELLSCVDRFNRDDKIDGILVQLPLPEHIDEQKVISRISPEKDVDGFHRQSAGSLMLGLDGFMSCTPFGVMKLLEAYDIPVRGKHAVVVGRSNIVGKPAALALLAKDATVTICHSKTIDLPSITRQADILVVSVGRPGMITAEYVKPGAVVIDVGITRVDGKIRGDVKFDEVSEIASYITPVPGGVGPMTIAMLMDNTVKSWEMKNKK